MLFAKILKFVVITLKIFKTSTMRTVNIFLAIIISIFLISGCKNDKSHKQTAKKLEQAVDSQAYSEINEKFNEAKQVVYSLPSPQEISYILFSEKDLSFDPTLLNPISAADKYTTDMSRALNLGIYSADISFATLFDQNQIAIDYMEVAKKLADKLGILNYFTDDDIQRIENNITNRDELMKIITEAYMKSDAQLQEDQRDDIGALILIGGWVEGMYIAVSLTNCNVKENPKLTSSIIEQQLSLALLVEFLNYYKDNKLLSEISKDIYELDNIFQNINTDIDENGNIVTTQEDFEKICKKIKQIRNSYVNMI